MQLHEVEGVLAQVCARAVGPGAERVERVGVGDVRVGTPTHLRRDGQLGSARGTLREELAEALTAIARPNVATVQIVFNVFRRQPLERVLPAAVAAGVGVIARVPLASGLLSGKYDASTVFAATDHRSYNRHGEAFDVGETFAGVPFEVGLDAVEELRPLVPEGATLAQLALRWILMHPAVTTVIPGARSPEQARGNAAAAELAPLDEATMREIARVYEERIAPHVHQRW